MQFNATKKTISSKRPLFMISRGSIMTTKSSRTPFSTSPSISHLVTWIKPTRALRTSKILPFGKKWQLCALNAKDWMLLKSALVTWSSQEELEAFARLKSSHKLKLNLQWWLFSWAWWTKQRASMKIAVDTICIARFVRAMPKLKRPYKFLRSMTVLI